MVSPVKILSLMIQSFDDFERLNFEERLVDFPSSHEEDNRLDNQTLDDLFRNGRHDWDARFVYIEGDPIYDTNCESNVDLHLYEEPHVERSHEQDEFEKDDFECLDDSFHLGSHKWDVGCFRKDPIYDTKCEHEDLINELGYDMSLENHDERPTNPSLGM